MYNLDKIDKAILNELQADCRQSTRELGKKLKMPASTVHQRIRKLAERGVIKSFSVIVNPEKVDMPTTALILVKKTTYRRGKIKTESVGEALAKLPEVQEVYLVSGQHDVILKVRGRNEREIGRWVFDTLWNVPGVERTLTLFVFHSAKDSHVLQIK